MPRIRVIVLILALSACTPSAGAPSLAPTLSNAATSVAATTVPPNTSAPAPSAACIDSGEFADNAESVMTGLQGVVSALKLSNTDQARTAAGTAASGLRKLADFVGPVQPEAANDFRAAASELDTAAAQFPGGLALVDQAQTDVTKGLLLTNAAGCSP
jgi:hypothetical protein